MAFKRKVKVEPEIKEQPRVEEQAPVIPDAPPAPEPVKAPEAPPAPKVEEKKPEPVVAPVVAPVITSAPAPIPPKAAVNSEFKSSDANMVQCRILDNINAVIGKRRYTFKKGTVAKVPGGVYEIFKQAKKAL